MHARAALFFFSRRLIYIIMLPHQLVTLVAASWRHTHYRLAFEEIHQQLECVLRECIAVAPAAGGEWESLELLPLVRWAAGRKPGTFVELGAYDGWESSQTWVLEKCFNWTGVLIEASPVLAKRLKRVDRPNSKKVWSAVCEPGTSIHLTGFNGTIHSGHGGSPSVLTSVESVTEKYVHSYGNWLDLNHTTTVPCRSMTEILQTELGVKEVDFISIDVQGAEDVVLKYSDLGRMPNGQQTAFKVVLVEAENTHMEKNLRVRRMLQDAGLIKLTHEFQPQKREFGAGYNDLYVRPSLVAPEFNRTTRLYGTRKQPALYPERLTGTSQYDRRSRSARFIDGLAAMDRMDDIVSLRANAGA